MRYKLLLLVVVVLLAGCNVFGGSATPEPTTTTDVATATPTETGAPPTQRTQQPNTATLTSTATPTPAPPTTQPSATETAEPTSSAFTEPSQYLPYSSELPVNGYLRTDEGTGTDATTAGRVAGAVRIFDRTEAATQNGPEQMSTQLTTYESERAAERAFDARLEEYATNASISYRSVVGTSVAEIQYETTDGQFVILSLAQYDNTIAAVEAHNEQAFTASTATETLRVMLLKLSAA